MWRRLPNEQRGFALALSLVLIALAATMSIAIAAQVLDDRRLEKATDDWDRNQALLSSLATVLMKRFDVDDEATHAGMLILEEQTLFYQIWRETGFIDLSYGDAALIDLGLRANGAEADAAQALTAKILDWRDEDDEPEINGAEQDWYQAKTIGNAPANGVLESFGVLSVIGDLPGHLARCPYEIFTLSSQRIRPDNRYLAPAIQAILSWAEDNQPEHPGLALLTIDDEGSDTSSGVDKTLPAYRMILTLSEPTTPSASLAVSFRKDSETNLGLPILTWPMWECEK